MTSEPGPTDQDVRFCPLETWTMRVTCKDAQGQVIDLTGALAAWRVASVDADMNIDSIVLEAEVDAGITIEAPETDGVLTIAVPAAMQGLIDVGVYRHELQITTADGAVSTQMVGLLTVLDSLFARDVNRSGRLVAAGTVTTTFVGTTA